MLLLLCWIFKIILKILFSILAGGYKLWKRLSFFVAIPAVALCMLNTYLKHQEDHETYVRPEFVKYEHLRIRNKRFPWGEGNKSLFHVRLIIQIVKHLKIILIHILFSFLPLEPRRKRPSRRL